MHNDELEVVAQKICKKHGLQFLGRVGEGAFKETFRIADSRGTPLALKIYKAANPSGRDQREISAMLRCKHTNIARILSVETYSHKGRRFVAITEEYLLGGTLTSKGQLTASQCLTLGAKLINALAYIAGLKLVHRDIKPDNIMFRADGITPVITDFGLVRDLADTSMTPTWAPHGPGTPFYSAPEQLNNEKGLIDWRTDQFALGIVLGSVALGEHPYHEGSAGAFETVEAVAKRNGPADWFIKRAAENGLPALTRMVAPWPVERFRRPADLQLAWREQKG